MKKIKVCSKCNQEKFLFYFNKDKNRKDGYYPVCRKCCNRGYNENKIKRLKQKQEYYLKNKEEIDKKHKAYYLSHKNLLQIAGTKYRKTRIKNDIGFRFLITLRCRINTALKQNYKHSKTRVLLGCSIKELKTYLENQFKSGMTWDNYGRGDNNKKEWQIDHIRPCASFDLSKLEEQQKCFHYTNLQPMWAKENHIKNDSY